MRTPPPPQRARPVPRGLPIGRTHPATPWGFPCCVDLPTRMPPPLPRRNRWRHPSLDSPQQWQPSPYSRWVGFRVTLFEACSAFTARCSLHARQVTKVTLYTEGFSRFVTSTTAPITTGWSESCRVGLSPTEKSRLSRRTEIFGLAHRRSVLPRDDDAIGGDWREHPVTEHPFGGCGTARLQHGGGTHSRADEPNADRPYADDFEPMLAQQSFELPVREVHAMNVPAQRQHRGADGMRVAVAVDNQVATFAHEATHCAERGLPQCMFRVAEKSKGRREIEFPEVNRVAREIGPHETTRWTFLPRGGEHGFGNIHAHRFGDQRSDGRDDSAGTAGEIDIAAASIHKLRHDLA